jgi:hypothetical protein
MLLLLFYSLLAVPYFLAFDSKESDCENNSFLQQVYIYGSGSLLGIMFAFGHYVCFWACVGAIRAAAAPRRERRTRMRMRLR